MIPRPDRSLAAPRFELSILLLLAHVGTPVTFGKKHYCTTPTLCNPGAVLARDNVLGYDLVNTSGWIKPNGPALGLRLPPGTARKPETRPQGTVVCYSGTRAAPHRSGAVARFIASLARVPRAGSNVSIALSFSETEAAGAKSFLAALHTELRRANATPRTLCRVQSSV